MKEVNPYTQAMAECLTNLDQSLDDVAQNEPVVYFLTNMVQGRMLEHLVCRIDEYYHLEDQSFEDELSSLLVDVFSETLFGEFRRKVEGDPALIFKVAQQIVHVECAPHSTVLRINHHFLCVFRKYLGYENLEVIVATLQSDSRIQKVILCALLKKNLNWFGYQMLHFLLDQDKQNFFTTAFILYGKNIHPLKERISKIRNRFKSRFTLSLRKS